MLEDLLQRFHRMIATVILKKVSHWITSCSIWIIMMYIRDFRCTIVSHFNIQMWAGIKTFILMRQTNIRSFSDSKYSNYLEDPSAWLRVKVVNTEGKVRASASHCIFIFFQNSWINDAELAPNNLKTQRWTYQQLLSKYFQKDIIAPQFMEMLHMHLVKVFSWNFNFW